MRKFTKEQLDILYNCMIASESNFKKEDIMEDFSVDEDTADKCINIARKNISFWNANKKEYKRMYENNEI